MIEVGKVGVLGPGTYQPCSTILPLVKGPALVKPTLKVKLTQPGVVSPGSIATYVNETGSPPLMPSPMRVTVRVTSSSSTDYKKWTDWFHETRKSRPPTRSQDNTSSSSYSAHL